MKPPSLWGLMKPIVSISVNKLHIILDVARNKNIFFLATSTSFPAQLTSSGVPPSSPQASPEYCWQVPSPSVYTLFKLHNRYLSSHSFLDGPFLLHSALCRWRYTEISSPLKHFWDSKGSYGTPIKKSLLGFREEEERTKKYSIKLSFRQMLLIPASMKKQDIFFSGYLWGGQKDKVLHHKVKVPLYYQIRFNDPKCPVVWIRNMYCSGSF